MITSLSQIQNVKDIFVLKECWAMPCGINSDQQIINNRWYVPIMYCANQCSMPVLNVVEEFMFSSGFNANAIGSIKFLIDNANEKEYELTSVVCSYLRYKTGETVYLDITNLK